ncbi:uncharacterized protein I206_104376 [Kwoniella pini CBS 10737]|uniref:Uncharacterized protein n=1 Tax=Kwoniella pini CBS 10737 TaxID=1296096 RepID=A0A1B9I1V0_9TREE|nr:uncharacterized protein I206_04044 [Kwoniella pini CBS 10737]OCF49523.1 hypothetical protein I206_04044 [Kwoniella pini CBS 10737]
MAFPSTSVPTLMSQAPSAHSRFIDVNGDSMMSSNVEDSLLTILEHFNKVTQMAINNTKSLEYYLNNPGITDRQTSSELGSAYREYMVQRKRLQDRLNEPNTSRLINSICRCGDPSVKDPQAVALGNSILQSDMRKEQAEEEYFELGRNYRNEYTQTLTSLVSLTQSIASRLSQPSVSQDTHVLMQQARTCRKRMTSLNGNIQRSRGPYLIFPFDEITNSTEHLVAEWKSWEEAKRSVSRLEKGKGRVEYEE